MKLIRSNPSTVGRVSSLNDWFENPFAGLPSLSRFMNWDGGPQDDRLRALAADIHEDKDNYYARFEVPGAKKEGVKVDLDERLLTVSVEKKEKRGDQESSYSLTRAISVPESVKPDAIGAKLEDGVLTVTLPKSEERKPRSIAVS